MTEKLNQEALAAGIRAECGDGCGWPTCGCDSGSHVVATRVVAAYLAALPLSASLAERTRERDEARRTLSDAYGANPANWPSTRLAAAEARMKALTEVTDEMVTAAMRGFEKFRPEQLRYREADGWHVCDRMAMRAALRSALASSDAAPESKDAGRVLKDALFALEGMGSAPASYGGVLTKGGKYAWLEYTLRDAAPESKKGWVLVPKELTEAMVDAYFDRCRELGFTSHITATTAWMALLAAAPQEPQP